MKVEQFSGKEFIKTNFPNFVEIYKIQNDRTFVGYETKYGMFIPSRQEQDNSFIEFSEKYVFVVLKNADFTEGRGPMRLHKIFKTLDNAISYILAQNGVYGSKQYMAIQYGVNINKEPFLYTYFNGYDIKIVEIE